MSSIRLYYLTLLPFLQKSLLHVRITPQARPGYPVSDNPLCISRTTVNFPESVVQSLDYPFLTPTCEAHPVFSPAKQPSNAVKHNKPPLLKMFKVQTCMWENYRIKVYNITKDSPIGTPLEPTAHFDIVHDLPYALHDPTPSLDNTRLLYPENGTKGCCINQAGDKLWSFDVTRQWRAYRRVVTQFSRDGSLVYLLQHYSREPDRNGVRINVCDTIKVLDSTTGEVLAKQELRDSKFPSINFIPHPDGKNVIIISGDTKVDPEKVFGWLAGLEEGALVVTELPWLQGELLGVTSDGKRCLVFKDRFFRHNNHSFFEIRTFPTGEVERTIRMKSRVNYVSLQRSGILDEGHAMVHIASFCKDGQWVANFFNLDMSNGMSYWKFENPYEECKMLYLGDGTVALVNENTKVITRQQVEPGAGVKRLDISAHIDELNGDKVDSR